MKFPRTAAVIALLSVACSSNGSNDDASGKAPATVPCSKQDGEACVADIECAAPPHLFANCYKAKCEVRLPMPHATKGESCGATCPSSACFGGTDSACYASEGIYCAMTRTCVPQEPEGAACLFAEQCVTGLTCVNKVCTTRGALGAACSDSDTCASGLFCAQGSCAMQKPIGSPCTSEEVNPCKDGICNAGNCAPDMSSGITCGTSGMGPGSGGAGG